ncbi:MAG: DUF5683 domain-containing protein [Candidatus Neomarinimicrobiota bacterium]
MRPSRLTLFYKIFLSVLVINIVLANEERSIENKDPKKAFYFSLVPGMGQIYNGKILKSAIFVGLEISAYVAWKDNSGKYSSYDSNNYPLKKHRYLEKRNKYAWWIGILYFYAMIDAVVDAHLDSFNLLMESPLKQKKQEKENK